MMVLSTPAIAADAHKAVEVQHGEIVVVRNVSTVWTRASGRLGADAQARVVLDQLELDLQGAILRDDGPTVFCFAAEVTDRAGVQGTPWQEAPRNPKPTGTGTNGSVNLTRPAIDDPLTRCGKAGMWLRFFTTSRGTNASAANASAPVAVSYQIVRRFVATNPANTNTAYLLHRVEARSAATAAGRLGVLDIGYNIRGSAYTTSTGSTNDGSQVGDPRTIQVVSTNSRGNLDAVIADNVIDFGIRAYVRDASFPGGLRLVFPANANGQPSGNASARYIPTLPRGTAPDATNFATILPDVIDVMVRVLTDEGAAQIANIEKNQTPALGVPLKYNGNAQAWWWGIAQENSRVYTRRIVLNATSL